MRKLVLSLCIVMPRNEKAYPTITYVKCDSICYHSLWLHHRHVKTYPFISYVKAHDISYAYDIPYANFI